MAEPRPASFPDLTRPGSLSGESSALAQTPTSLLNSRSCPTCGGRYPADFKVCPHDATPLEDAPPDGDDPMVGQQLGGTYEVLRVIGEGGMGRVYEARHTRLSKKRFAIKMLHHELSRQPEVVTRFQREAEASSVLSHPNVVSVFDVNVAADGRPYLVAELLEGDQFGDYLDRRGKLPIEEAVRIVRQVCRALAVAHETGIVHRDMKPENVFLARGNDLVKVLDFGISKLAETTDNLTKTGMVMGTPDYMAPEQARGDRVDARADIYAVGAMLYRAVTGQKPFEGLDAMGTLTAALVQEPPRPTSIDPSIPLALEMVIQRAMAKDPRERYQTMHDLDEALIPFDRAGLVVPAESGEQVIAVRAKTLFSTPERVQSSTFAGGVFHLPRLARPGLLLFSALGFIWLLGNVTVAVAAFMRLLRSSDDLTQSESVLVPIGVFTAIVTPLVVWIRHLAREVWPNTPKSVELAAQLRKAILYSACAYAFAALIVQFLETIVNRDADGVARPAWALVAFQAALLVGVVTWVVMRAKRNTA
jgi:serine/threonine-protein kinase